MQRLLFAVDSLSTWVGKTFSWLIVSLTVLVTFEVIARYAFRSPHAWAFDTMLMMYGTFFMMSGAYTLSKNNHVRGDVLYGFFPPRVQATIDLVLYVVFFLPGVVALCWAGYRYAGESWAILEHSNVSAEGPPVYVFKTVIPVAGSFLLLQGLVEIVRCVYCLRDGRWPPRQHDVEEVDVDKLKEMVLAPGQEIAELDRGTAAAEGGSR